MVDNSPEEKYKKFIIPAKIISSFGGEMAECEKLQKCQLIAAQTAANPAWAEMTKQTYCLGNNMKCARYQLVLEGVRVPVDLLPCDYVRAQKCREEDD
jgi:hypothetical protein